MNGPGTRAGNASADEASVRQDALGSAATLIASCRTAFYPVRKTRKVRTYGVPPSSRRIHFARRNASWSELRPRRISHTLQGRRVGIEGSSGSEWSAGWLGRSSRYEGRANRQGHTLYCGGTCIDQYSPTVAPRCLDPLSDRDTGSGHDKRARAKRRAMKGKRTPAHLTESGLSMTIVIAQMPRGCGRSVGS